MVQVKISQMKYATKSCKRKLPENQQNKYSMGYTMIVDFALFLSVFASSIPYVESGIDLENSAEQIVRKRQLREAGFETFEISSIHQLSTSDLTKLPLSAATLRRHKRDAELSALSLSVSIHTHGEQFHLDVRHVKSPLHPKAKVLFGNHDDLKPWYGQHPDCFLRGHVSSHGGTVSMAFCDNLIGSFTTNQHIYVIESLPDNHLENSSEHYDNTTNIVVARKRRDTFPDSIAEEVVSVVLEEDINVDRSYSDQAHRQKRQVPARTVEVALWSDSLYTTYMEDAGATTDADKIQFMVMKWNGVQAEWARSDVLGYDMTIEIKKMTFWTTDPATYDDGWQTRSSIVMSNGRAAFCDTVKNNNTEYDHLHMHTGVTSGDVSGLAGQDGCCDISGKCVISRERPPPEYIISAHELGHCVGMRHDSDQGCTDAATQGIMGSGFFGWSTCSVTDFTTYMTSSAASCLEQQNVNDADVPTELQNLNLAEVWTGMMYTDDEVCAMKFGSGYRFRKYPEWTDDCTWYSCINMNAGSTYGTFERVVYPIYGHYCGDEMVCANTDCISWADTGLNQSLISSVQGGWGDWGSWTSTCSRTCGTGVKLRTRVCDNPKPLLSTGCIGNEVDAEVCQTTACPGDPTSESDLINTRASETCTDLISNSIFDGSNYDGTGSRYSSSGTGICEVTCSGTTVPSNQRFGLMPDGTPCDIGSTGNVADENGYPRVSGIEGRCVLGVCYTFGCDGKIGSTVNDGCGVCNGNNLTCDIYEGVYTDSTIKGLRNDMATLPVGSYNIQYYFNWNDQKQVYIELYESDGSTAILQYGASYPFEETSIAAAGTTWYFYYLSHYMYSHGPTTEEIVIKLYQKGNNVNTGVNYAYSVEAECNGTCQNGGTWNNASCSCDCPAGLYATNGTYCETTCPNVCLNGGVRNETTCICTCPERTFGDDCSCKYPYTGTNCTDCKFDSCLWCGTFNSSTCRCECLDGYSGLQCEADCVNNNDTTCAAAAADGNCTSDNINMEQNCPLACGVCVASSPKATCVTTATSTTSTTTTSTTTTVTTTTTTGPTTTSQGPCPAPDEQRCSDGICIAEDRFCDSVNDCADGSDELESTCRGCNLTVNRLLFICSLLLLIWTRDS